MEGKDFYIHLGKLLYSVAMADGEVQNEELEELYKLVTTEIADEKLFDNNQADVFYTEFEFEELMNKKTSRIEAFQSFLKFFDENHTSFSVEIKAVTVNAVEQIAKSFNGIIEEERVMIDELKDRMKLM